MSLIIRVGGNPPADTDKVASAVASDTDGVIKALADHRDEHVDEMILGDNLAPETVAVVRDIIVNPAESGLKFDIDEIAVSHQLAGCDELVADFQAAGYKAEPVDIVDIP